MFKQIGFHLDVHGSDLIQAGFGCQCKWGLRKCWQKGHEATWTTRHYGYVGTWIAGNLGNRALRTCGHLESWVIQEGHVFTRDIWPPGRALKMAQK